MSREITVVVRGQTGSVTTQPLKGGGAITAESHNNYRLLVDGKEKLPDGTRIHRSGRDLKIRFADGEEVTISDWAGADGARFETGGAQVYSDTLRSFVPAQQVESWQFEILGTGDVVAGQLGVAPEALLASAALAAPVAPAVPAASIPAVATPVTGAASAAGATVGAGATAAASTGAAKAGATAAAAGGGFSGTGVLLGLGALGGLAAAAGGGGGSSSGGGGATSNSAAPSAPTGLALAVASDSGTTGDNVTSDTTPTISGRGDAGSSIEVRNAAGTTIATATVDSAGNWTATPSTALADGSQTLQVVANRGTGTTASAATPFTVTIDSTAPAAPVARLDAASDTGVAGDSRTNDNTPTLSGTGNAGDTIRVTLPGGVVLTTVVAGNGTWNVTPTTALADGAANISVTATDVAGNVSPAATLSITVDTTAPGAPTLAVPEGPVVNAAENADGIQANVTGSFVAGDTVSVLVTRPDATTTTVTRTVSAAEATAGVVALTIPSQTVQGGYTLRATITDAAGNAGAASAPVALTLASSGLSAPTLTIAEAADNFINAVEASNGTPVTVTLPTGTVSGSTIALVLAVPNSAAVTIPYTVTGADATAGSATVTIPNANIAANGAYSLFGTVTDPNGNVGAPSAARLFTVDRTVVATSAPDLATASDTGSSSTDNLTRNTTPTFTGSGAEAGATVTLYDTNGTTVLGTGIADAAGAWSIVSQALSAGAHTVTTRQVDLAGNASTASAGLAMTVDAAAPTFGTALAVNEGFATLSIDGATLAGTDNLTKQASLAVSAATFKSAVGFVAGDLGISLVNGKATVTPVAGAINKNGSVVLSVSMQDAAGNTTTQDVTVTVNAVNDAPAGADRTVTAPEDGVYTFSSSDFTFTDAADTPANAFKSVVVSSLPGAGSLRNDGKSVTGGQEVTAADLAAGKLTFTPVANANGAGYASFTFQVRDDGGTANGGVDLDGSANKITINVVDSNQAPVLDASKSPAISTAEYAFSGGTDAAVHAPAGANPTGVFTAASLLTGAVSDADPGAKLGVGVTGLSAAAVGATLWYSTDAGTTWDWISNTAGSKVTTGFYGANGVIGGTDNNVLLLADTARLVFDAGKSGQQAAMADALTIRAWDQSSGTNGNALTNPTVGSDAPLSAATDSVQANFTTRTIDLTRLDASAGVRINGATAGTQFGWDVTTAGDANGDGFDDMLVSQRGTAGTGGSAFLVYGQAGTFGSVGADGTRSVGIGAVTGARFDRPGEFMTGVTNLGDFNNDGYADFMISGVRTNDSETGTSYVVFGGPAIANIGALGVPNANGNWFQIQAGGTSGIGYNNHAASWTGDVNGDGYDDLIIGAKYTPQQSTAPMGFGSGAAYVIYGHAGTKFGTGNNLSLAALRTDVTQLADDGNPAGYLFDAGTDTRGIVLGVGASPGYFFGRGVAGVGDRNGDGYADYAVDVDLGAGAVNSLIMHGDLTTDTTGGGGGNVLWFAAASGYTGPDWIGHGGVVGAPFGGVNPYRIRVGGNNDYTGSQDEPDRISTQALGDVNGDGFDDWAMSYNGIGAGKVYVIYGSTTVFDDQASAALAAGSAGFSITGVALGDKLGESIHGIGDVNGDGYDDIIVGAPRTEVGTATDQGGAYIIYGRPDAGADDIDLATGIGTRGVAIRGGVTGDLAGFAVNSAGDVNGDGLDDLMIGAPQNDAGAADAGAAYLIYGNTAYRDPTTVVGTTVLGTGTADTLNGAGAQSVAGGAGNDTITVDSNAWRRIDGGAGLDTLKIGSVTTLDFTAVGTAPGQNLSGRTRSIERIDLGAGAGNASKMTIAEQDVYQIAGDFTASGGTLSGRQSNTLFVVGDASDTFTFAEGVGGTTGWTVAATAVDALGDTNSYTEFTRGTASVYVASAITVSGVTSGTAAANLITGTASNQLIAGLGGADIITGGAGDDTLYGGAIGSVATADGIKDIFAYSLTPNTAHGNDVIKDFQRGTDRLYLVDTADSYTGNSVAVSAVAPNGSTAAYAANGTTYQGFTAGVVQTATTNDDIDNNLSIRDLTQADSANQYLTFGTDGLGNVRLTVVAGAATSSIVLEGVQYEATSTASNGKYSSIADLMGADGETRVLYLTNDPFGPGLATLP